MEIAEQVGGKGRHHFKNVAVPFNLVDDQLFIEEACQTRPNSSETACLMSVAAELNVNILTGKSLKSGELLRKRRGFIKRQKGCYARDPVSSLLHIYKSICSDKRAPNWAGAAFNTMNL